MNDDEIINATKILNIMNEKIDYQDYKDKSRTDNKNIMNSISKSNFEIKNGCS